MTTAPGANRDSCTSSQCPLGPEGCRSTSLPPIVLIAMSIRPSFATSAAAAPRPFRRMPLGRDHALGVPEVAASPTGGAAPTGASTRTGFCVGGEVRDRDRAGGEQQAGRARVGEVDPRGAPAGEAGPERRVEAPPDARERCRRAVCTYAAEGSLRELVTKRPSRPPVVDVRRDSHPGVRVGDAGGGGALLEPEAEPGRIGARAAGPRDVDVQLVRILVVRDVDVRAAVAVDVGERRAEPVAEARRLRGPPGSPTSLKRPPPSFR